MSENNIKTVIEALLFASEKPLSIDEMRKALDGLEPSQVRAALEELKTEYEQSSRGVRIIEVAGGFQMATSPYSAPFLKKFYKERNKERLSRQALETLAIIAYKQPITKLEIESLRSVNADGVMKSLLEKSLIRIAGRKKSPGRPFVFGTTRQFLEHFGLKSLEDLPEVQELNSVEVKREPGEIELQEEGVIDGEAEPGASA